MKTFGKVFILSIIFFVFAIYLGSYSYVKLNDAGPYTELRSLAETKENYNQEGGIEENINIEEGIEAREEIVEETYNSLAEAVKAKKRINILFTGLEGVRTDTIILSSFDTVNKKLDNIFIPRDTYIHRKGYNKAEQRKINAIYGSHGIAGVKKAASYLLEDIPIDHHIIIDYEGVEKIVDYLGGIEVEVPFPMVYTDKSAEPPLYINIPEGKQLLNGKQAMNFLRYRKGNKKKSGYIDGDIGRIRAQQEFLKSFASKVLSYKLPLVVKKAFRYVETDIKLMDALNYVTKAYGIQEEDFEFEILPGKSEFKRVDGQLLSYFTPNNAETEKLLKRLYNVK